MNDERVLETRLRTQLTRWAEHAFPDAGADAANELPETVPVVAMSEPVTVERAKRGATSRVLVAAAVVVALACTTVVVRTHRSDPRATAAEVANLARVEWRFVEFVVDGERFSAPTDSYWALRFDGAGHFSGTACNGFGGDVTIRRDTLDFDGEQGQTAAYCLDSTARRIEDAVTRLRDGSPTWSVRNDTLHLAVRGVEAELTRAVSVFPTADLVVLASSERDGTPGQWQFGYPPKLPQYLYWEGRSEPGTAFGNVGVQLDSSTVWATTVSLGSGFVVLGSVPDSAASAKYVADAKVAVQLTLYKVPGGHHAFAQAAHVGKGEVIAYDTKGHEVGRTRVLSG